MPGVARLGDRISTGHACSTTSSIIGCSGNVITNGRRTARRGDGIAPHVIRAGKKCVPHPGQRVNNGSGSVFVNGRPIARIGDSADKGRVTSGSGDVSAG